MDVDDHRRRILYQFFEVNAPNSLSVPPCISTAFKELDSRMHKSGCHSEWISELAEPWPGDEDMRKAVRAVVLAVALVQSSAVAGNELVLTDARIAECRAMLKLSADQELYWGPIEATLRDIARRPNAAGAALDDKSLRRLLALATPLFQRLGPEQKRTLISLAHSLGLLRFSFTF